MVLYSSGSQLTPSGGLDRQREEDTEEEEPALIDSVVDGCDYSLFMLPVHSV